MSAPGAAGVVNAMTVDVEEWFQVSAFESVVRYEDWARYESRVERSTGRILDRLAAAGVRATFFVLGWVAERHPALVKALHGAGHEVASHGYRHRLLTTMTPAEFRDDTIRARQVLEDLTGAPVLGYRAASYSIVRETVWCLDVLGELGFHYDSSIFPVHHDRYGMPEARRFPHRLSAGGLWEFPPSTVRIGGVNVPVAGGGYLRLLPYRVVRWGLKRINDREGQPAAVYLHPWEVDPEQPRLRGPWRSRFRHYVNLAGTETKLARLLCDFRFAPMRETLRRLDPALPAVAGAR
jgi:polysaccharide deacetylase family protein (PEP-CTERM system associated)